MKWTTIVFILLLTSLADAQEPLSPPARTSVTINGKRLLIAYSSPVSVGVKSWAA